MDYHQFPIHEDEKASQFHTAKHEEDCDSIVTL